MDGRTHSWLITMQMRPNSRFDGQSIVAKRAREGITKSVSSGLAKWWFNKFCIVSKCGCDSKCVTQMTAHACFRPIVATCDFGCGCKGNSLLDATLTLTQRPSKGYLAVKGLTLFGSKNTSAPALSSGLLSRYWLLLSVLCYQATIS